MPARRHAAAAGRGTPNSGPRRIAQSELRPMPRRRRLRGGFILRSETPDRAASPLAESASPSDSRSFSASFKADCAPRVSPTQRARLPISCNAHVRGRLPLLLRRGDTARAPSPRRPTAHRPPTRPREPGRAEALPPSGGCCPPAAARTGAPRIRRATREISPVSFGPAGVVGDRPVDRREVEVFVRRLSPMPSASRCPAWVPITSARWRSATVCARCRRAPRCRRCGARGWNAGSAASTSTTRVAAS